MSATQKSRVLDHLLKGNTISPLEAFGVFKITRLAARINDLRNEGHDIRTIMKADATGTPYAEYRLVRRKQPRAA